MSRRSPNYPSIDLGAAIDAMRAVVSRQRQNAMSRDQLARHLGHRGLNGHALEKIAAVRAYGLVEGRGERMRVSDDLITILEGSNRAAERTMALARRAFHPTIFQQISALQRHENVDESDLRVWLRARGFTPRAVERLVVVYPVTIQLLADEGGSYLMLADSSESDGYTPNAGQAARAEVAASAGAPIAAMPSPSGSRREIIALAEGDVTITFPESLSMESYEDLADSLELFLRKARRRIAPNQ